MRPSRDLAHLRPIFKEISPPPFCPPSLPAASVRDYPAGAGSAADLALWLRSNGLRHPLPPLWIQARGFKALATAAELTAALQTDCWYPRQQERKRAASLLASKRPRRKPPAAGTPDGAASLLAGLAIPSDEA
jgi:hypothetical protein